MRVSNSLVFDEYITTGTFFTDSNFITGAGRFDSMCIMAVTDNIDLAGQITVQLQHAADGRNFVNKNATAEITGAGTGVGKGTISTGQTNVNWGFDNGVSPSLGLVRLAISFTTTTKGHVKVYVTLRDQGG